jgi:hypothetical protein
MAMDNMHKPIHNPMGKGPSILLLRTILIGRIGNRSSRRGSLPMALSASARSGPYNLFSGILILARPADSLKAYFIVGSPLSGP